MRKARVLVFLANVMNAEHVATGRMLQAQFRNVNHVGDEKEPADFVMGDTIPEQYSEVPKLDPETALVAVAEWQGSTPTHIVEKDASDASGEEFDLEDLEGLSKAELIQFAADNEIELTSEDKKNKDNLLGAISDFFETQD